MKCIDCGEAISATRLAAVPFAKRCTTCQSHREETVDERIKGFMSWEHKTAPELITYNPAEFRELQRNDRRGPKPQLPMGAKGVASLTTPAPEQTAAYNPTTGTVSTEDGVEWTADFVPARCHRYRAVVDRRRGLCAECAAEWYKRRLPKGD